VLGPIAERARILFCSCRDAEIVFGIDGPSQDRPRRLRAAFGAEHVVSTDQCNGVHYAGPDDRYGIGATAKIIGPALMGVLVGGSMIKQNVTVQAVPPAFFLFAALLVLGGIIYLFARETRAVALEEV
jgi:putative MFS transporter